MNHPFSVAVLISGRGSNLNNLLVKANDYKISAIVSDQPTAAGLQYGAEFGVKTAVVSRADFPSLKAMKAELLSTVNSLTPDLVALAGFMQIIDPEFVEAFKGKLINIHPSLLPEFPGLNTHERAIEAKVKHHGCTVHFVDCGVDTGPIIAQASCEVLPGDSAENLSARVLALEHQIYPWVVSAIARKDIWLKEGHTHFSSQARAEAQRQNFTIPK